MENKQIQASGILIMLLTVVGMLIYYTWFKRVIPEEASIPLLVVLVPFAMGLFNNASKPQKAQLLQSIWGIFGSLITKKISLMEAMKQMEIIMATAVNVWFAANEKAKLAVEKAKEDPPEKGDVYKNPLNMEP